MAVARLSHEWLSCTAGGRVLYAMVLGSFPNRGLHTVLLYSCACAGSLVVWDRASVTDAFYYSKIICQWVPHRIDFHGGEITRTSWQDGWSTADRVFTFYAVNGVTRKRERGEGGKSSESQVIFVIILAGYAWPSAQASDTLRSVKSDAANQKCHFVCVTTFWLCFLYYAGLCYNLVPVTVSVTWCQEPYMLGSDALSLETLPMNPYYRRNFFEAISATVLDLDCENPTLHNFAVSAVFWDAHGWESR